MAELGPCPSSLAALLALGTAGCRGTPQPVTRAEAPKETKAPAAAPRRRPPRPPRRPLAAAPPRPAAGDAAPVVVDAGVEAATTPQTPGRGRPGRDGSGGPTPASRSR